MKKMKPIVASYPKNKQQQQQLLSATVAGRTPINSTLPSLRDPALFNTLPPPPIDPPLTLRDPLKEGWLISSIEEANQEKGQTYYASHILPAMMKDRQMQMMTPHEAMRQHYIGVDNHKGVLNNAVDGSIHKTTTTNKAPRRRASKKNSGEVVSSSSSSSVVEGQRMMMTTKQSDSCHVPPNYNSNTTPSTSISSLFHCAISGGDRMIVGNGSNQSSNPNDSGSSNQNSTHGNHSGVSSNNLSDPLRHQSYDVDNNHHHGDNHHQQQQHQQHPHHHQQQSHDNNQHNGNTVDLGATFSNLNPADYNNCDEYSLMMPEFSFGMSFSNF